MSVQMQIDPQAVQRAQTMLSGIPGAADKAIKSALSRTASRLRTDSSKAVRERYALPASAIRKNETVSVRYTYQNGAQAFLSFAGHKIPLYRYNGTSPKMPSVREVVRAHQLNSTSPVPFQNAFIAQMKSGHIGIFERTGGKTAENKDEIREIMGLAVPQMLGGQEVQEKLTAQAMETFAKNVDHEILAFLNGWRTI